MRKQRKTLLITGGAGFIGTNVSLEALRRGYDVIVVDSLIRQGSENNAHMLTSIGVDVVRMDITHPSFDPLSIFTEVIPPMGIIHLAANTGIGVSLNNPFFDFNQNTVGTLKMLEIARFLHIPLIYASTNKVYSDAVNAVPTKKGDLRYTWDIKGIDETFRTDGSHHTPYGVSKLSGDMYCQEYFQSFGVQTVVNRMSCIYGLYQNGAEEQGWVDHFIRTNMFGDGKVNIYGDGKQVRDVLWGMDVAQLYLEELENINKVEGQVFNVGGGNKNTLSLLECMESISCYTDIDFDPKFKKWRDADQKIYISDISKVEKTLGWKPTVSPEKGIELMVKEYSK